MSALDRPLRAADDFQRRHVVLAFAVGVWVKFRDDKAGNLAALIAYYAFAAIFPLLLLLTTVLDIALRNNPALRDRLLTSALSQYPVIGPQIKASLGSIPGSGLPLAIGALLLLFGARGVARAMQNAMCEVWGIPAGDRPRFPLSLFWGIALVLVIGLGFTVTTSLSGLASGAGHLLGGVGAAVGAVAIALVLNFCVFWLGFRIAAGLRIGWRDLRIGAAIGAVCWQALQFAGGYVVSHQLHRASELYGVFGIVLGLLTWLFVQAEVTLYAVEVDVVRARRLWPRSVSPPGPHEPAVSGQGGNPDPGKAAAAEGPAPRGPAERAGHACAKGSPLDFPRAGRGQAIGGQQALEGRGSDMADEARVVIIGAGFAGLNAVRGLRSAGVRVTVVDKNLYSTFQPLLYQVATGGLNPGDVAYPVGGVTTRRDARYIRGELASIDQGARVIRLVGGREVGYDYLILATGMSANYFGLEGAEEHTYGLYTRADAIVLRDHIMNGFEWLSADPDGRREFAVTMVGGGATGVELAGTLGELRSTVLRSTFPDVDPERMQIRLVEMAPQLLMPFHPKLREYTRRQLVSRGVDIRLNTEIRKVTQDSVELADGTTLRSDLTVWTAGVAAHHSVATWGLPQGKNGRLLVQSDLRVQGSDRIFAAGDMALDDENPSPQLAQPAIQEGRHVAAQIVHLLGGQPTEQFHYQDKGTMATIGRRSAVVELSRGIRFTGTVAWLAWLGLHLVYLLGNRNRVATLINLTWRYIAWGHGGGVIVGDEPTEPLHGEVGDAARHNQQEKQRKQGSSASSSAG